MPLKSVLITGGSGFVGRHIVLSLLESHPACLITVLDLAQAIADSERIAGVRYVVGDILDRESLRQVLSGERRGDSESKAAEGPSEHQTAFQVVIHTAGIVPPIAERYHRRIEALVMKINVQGTRNVVEVAREVGLGAMVFTSSCCTVIDNMANEYRNIDERWPTSSTNSTIYGESKAVAETIVLEANSPTFATCALRPSVLMGPGDPHLVPTLYNVISKGETPFIVGAAENLWDVTYVTNIADAHVLAAENLVTGPKTAAGEAFFIQNNTPITFRDFSLAIWKEFDHYPMFEISIPHSLAWFFGLMAEMASWATGSEFPTLSRGSVNDACAMRYASGKKAREILGFEPRVGLEEGIKLSCADLKLRLSGETTEAYFGKRKELLRLKKGLL